MKILIVDDEQLARERLQDLLTEIDAQHNLFQAGNGIDALKVIEESNPEVVLLDIRMPLMDGLETASHLCSLDNPPAVIFTTAYQDHALEAFDKNAIDYLLKPIRGERLEQALTRANIINKGRIDGLRNQDPDKQPRSHLSVSAHGKIDLIPIPEIRYLKAEQKYVTIGLQGRENLVDEPLKSLEDEFQSTFLRIHRNALVALDHVESLQKDNSGTYSVGLQGVTDRLPVSRRHLSEVRRVIKNLKL